MRAFRRLSITARLTWGSIAISFVVTVVAVVGVYFAVAAILTGSTATLLRSDADPYVVQIESGQGASVTAPGEDQNIAVVSPDDVVRLTSFPRGLRRRLDAIVAFPAGRHVVTTGATSYLVLTQAVPGAEGTWKVIAARTTAPDSLILGRLTSVMVASAAVVVIGSGIASLLLARQALRPVEQMRGRATALSRGATSGVLPVGEARDELRELAETLNDLIRQLRASAERERQMVSDASHELRTPLAVLQGRLELAERSGDDREALLTDIRGARRDAERLARLAGNLLELSRLDSRHDESRSEWHELVEETAESVERGQTLAARDAEVVLDPAAWTVEAPDAAVSVADWGRLVDNLVSNAVGAARRSGRHARIEVALTSDGTTLTALVCDDAGGMPPDFVAVAFDRFTRSQASRAGGASGGLGLAIVAAIVERAGGAITLDNRPGDGLTMRVSLPHTPS